ncbi:WW domain binding protein 2 [Cichlidogyrus casuarinus]|uniref:WW domain binding protein 2 n=1 Tax=Cichlidogyrus casuarinus TaxID=1844966 RepID=A0ABD2QG41_9PLAT
MSQVNVSQPVFGANKVIGNCTSDNTTFWSGQAKFSIAFCKGGAIEFTKALVELGTRTHKNAKSYVPPSYTDAMLNPGRYSTDETPAYQFPYTDPVYGFIQPHESFVAPPQHYQGQAPPPYPGSTSSVPQNSSSGVAWSNAPPPAYQPNVGFNQMDTGASVYPSAPRQCW